MRLQIDINISVTLSSQAQRILSKTLRLIRRTVLHTLFTPTELPLSAHPIPRTDNSNRYSWKGVSRLSPRLYKSGMITLGSQFIVSSLATIPITLAALISPSLGQILEPGNGPVIVHPENGSSTSSTVSGVDQSSLSSRFRILPSPLPKNILKIDPTALGKDIRVWFPEYDGDGFYAVIDPKTIRSTTAPEIMPSNTFQNAILPILTSLGFPTSITPPFAMPDDKQSGIPIKRASLSRVVTHLCFEFPVADHKKEVNQLLSPLTLSETTEEMVHLIHNTTPPSPSTNNRPSTHSVEADRQKSFQDGVKKFCEVLEVIGDKERLALLEKNHSSFIADLDPIFITMTGQTVRQFARAFERQEIFYFYPQIHKPVQAEFLRRSPLPEAVTIDHVGILASRREGETVFSAAGRVLVSYKVANKALYSPAEAIKAASKELQIRTSIQKIEPISPNSPTLVLLPTGKVESGASPYPALRYAYRMPVFVSVGGLRAFFYLWIDAEEGKLLELHPLFDSIGGHEEAKGQALDNDPGLLPSVYPRWARLDPRTDEDNRFILEVTNELVGPPFVIVNPPPPPISGSPPTWDFTTIPIPSTNQLELFCSSSQTQDWEAYDLFATVFWYSELSALAPPLQNSPISINLGLPYPASSGVLAGHSFPQLTFNVYYPDPHSCPNTDMVRKSYLDHTVVAHEMGHLLTQQKYMSRNRTDTQNQTRWCGEPTLFNPPSECPIYQDAPYVHDFADAWVQVLEDTNCVGGWLGQKAKATPLEQNSLHCLQHHEGGSIPRLSRVPDPQKFFYQYNVDTEYHPYLNQPGGWDEDFARGVGDHFPEHRRIFDKDPLSISDPSSVPEYADMQIAAAALWQVREGMRSLSYPMGSISYFYRFMRAIELTGWLGIDTEPLTNTPRNANNYSDRDIYRALVDLEVKLAHQWSNETTMIDRTINKVAAGFARAGIFMIHPSCLNDSGQIPAFCENAAGADAVIDVTDNDCVDDWVAHGTGIPCGQEAMPPIPIPGVLHREQDYLRPGEPIPGFHVWTGPRYLFSYPDASDYRSAIPASPPPCNNIFKIEVAEDEGFTQILATSGWLETSPLRPCYCNWTFSVAEWNAITKKLAMDNKDRFYYRLKTCRGSVSDLVFVTYGANTCESPVAHPLSNYRTRISTRPANGMFGDFPPPYAIVNASGTYPWVGSSALPENFPFEVTPPPVSDSITPALTPRAKFSPFQERKSLSRLQGISKIPFSVCSESEWFNLHRHFVKNRILDDQVCENSP